MGGVGLCMGAAIMGMGESGPATVGMGKRGPAIMCTGVRGEGGMG